MYKMISRHAWCLLLAGLLIGGCSKCPVVPEGDTNRTVLVELFSFVGCAFCPNAEEAVDSLKSEYRDSLAVLIYHMRVSGDTLSPEDAQTRAEWYGVSAAPTALFDGDRKLVGASTVEIAYNSYKDRIVTRRSTPSSFEMSTDVTLTPSNIQVDCEVIALGSTKQGLQVRVVLFQDSVIVEQSRYDFVVRWIEETDLLWAGSDTFRVTFSLPRRWTTGALGIVGFLQDDATQEVLQSVVEDVSQPLPQHGFELVYLDDTLQTVPADTEAVFHLTLQNTGDLQDVYEMSLETVVSASGWFENFCFGGLCLVPPAVGLNELSPGEIDTTISVHVMPLGNPGSEVVCFKVRSQGDPTLVDSVLFYTESEGALHSAVPEDYHFNLAPLPLQRSQPVRFKPERSGEDRW